MSGSRTLLAVVLVAVAGMAHADQAAVRLEDGRYRVAHGDTLSRISRTFRVRVGDIASLNGIRNPSRIFAGDVLRIPGDTAASPPAARASASRSVASLSTRSVVVGAGPSTYVVVAGDSFDRIARRFGTTARELARDNRHPLGRPLRIGTRLTVPGAGWACPVAGATSFSAASWGAPRPGGRRHLGVDLFARRGTPVIASVGGRLRLAPGATAGLAYYLHGDDGNTYYGAHLDEIRAAPGRVEPGAVLGTVGDTGNARGTSPHLHFEIHLGGSEPVNPYPTLERWC